MLSMVFCSTFDYELKPRCLKGKCFLTNPYPTYPRVSGGGYSSGMVEKLGDEDGAPDGDGVKWDAVRLEVRLGELTRNAICRKYGITPGRLAKRIRANKWDVEEDSTVHDFGLVLGQLFFALERQAEHLTKVEMTGLVDREVATLQRLTATLDRLIGLDRQLSGGRKPERRESSQMKELRARIAKRLDELEVK